MKAIASRYMKTKPHETSELYGLISFKWPS